MIFLQLFWVFLQIGLFGFGGGYAMLSMIQQQVVVHYGWLDASRFADLVAISQMTPGPISINCATYIGYEAVIQAGFPVWAAIGGSLLASLAICLPCFILMGLVLHFLFGKRTPVWLKGALQGLKLAVVGLLFSAALLLMTPQNFIDEKSVLICMGSFLVVLFTKWSPIWLILASGLCGYLLY